MNEDKRPNLLFVFADQMRGMDMNCSGNPQLQTPNMDRLASEGALFSRAYANAPVCTPSRAIMLSGKYPLSNSVIANDLPLPEEENTIGKLIQQAGYRTGYIGKWHLDGVPRNKFIPPGLRRHGFEFWAAWNCAHSYFNGKLFKDEPEPIQLEGYEPIGQTDIAIEFLKSSASNDKRPFCLFLSWGPPHDPYEQVPEKYKSLYNPASIQLRPNFRPISPGPYDISGQRDHKATLACYYAHITALDEQLGRLLQTLDELNLAEDTIVIFTSDHGDMLWSQGMMKKQQPWEESISIPFLIRWSGRIKEGRSCGTLLSIIDFSPTILGLMGLEVPKDMQGANLAAAILGQTPSYSSHSPSSVFLMDIITMDEAFRQGLSEWRGVRTKRYTYARWANGNGWILYDNQADPYQLNNLISSAKHASICHELEAELQSWLERTDDECLSWEENIRRLGLVALWNAREQELHPKNPRLLNE